MFEHETGHHGHLAEAEHGDDIRGFANGAIMVVKLVKHRFVVVRVNSASIKRQGEAVVIV